MSGFQAQTHILIKKLATLESLWRLSKFNPTDEQREAILHVNGPLFLMAEPGSAKTHVFLSG